MADDQTPVRKSYKAAYSDPMNPNSAELSPKISEKRRALWNTLAEFIHVNGGWTTSPPGSKVLRFEVPKDSALPTKLAAYEPHHVEATTRITAGGRFSRVDVVEILLK